MITHYTLRDTGKEIQITPGILYTENGMVYTQTTFGRGAKSHEFKPTLAHMEWLRIPLSHITCIGQEDEDSNTVPD